MINEFRKTLDKIQDINPILANALIEGLEIIHNNSLRTDLNPRALEIPVGARFGTWLNDNQIPKNARKRVGTMGAEFAPGNAPFGGGGVNTPNSYADLGTPGGMPY